MNKISWWIQFCKEYNFAMNTILQWIKSASNCRHQNVGLVNKLETRFYKLVNKWIWCKICASFAHKLHSEHKIIG